MSVREICEAATARDASARSRFNLAQLCEQLLKDPEFRAAFPHAVELHRILGQRAATRVTRALVRHALLIQLVTARVNTTLYEVRWTNRLAPDDPRRADVDSCLKILARSSELALEAANRPAGRDAIVGLATQAKVANELPVDYVDRHATQLHHADNLRWLDDDLADRLVQQRRVLLNRGLNPEYAVFAAAYGKIKVKTYQTDRAQTGVNKTNREYRWETHPRSVQFALRGDCMAIERKLVDDLCHLHDLPSSVRTVLAETGLIQPGGEATRCPVTLDLLSYADFKAEMLDPQHGRAAFQVGHLNPLKAVNDDPTTGHTAANVGWISQDGNRIQGHLTLAEARKLLNRIRANYAELMPD